ncbi:glycoside hydrolase family 76 protein [Mucilaginibacter myungsuensis]|uniref:Alpha-1,6-mannanase n=1 Tax=Mucilaginibacter myungsuensis TaxID=649104 RepID=A0A929KV30_9SPHI|nr:glycoside hydrolase family 76 protein [Mucilaginibacter myungsuensis]MBE9660428.1 alpha-1,6-mannanase [Mucilaginibacter myungsuensis]MDN3600470.1 glycoside hydrolase family 76 protein [Mucilaginibacter myungsuensis]
MKILSKIITLLLIISVILVSCTKNVDPPLPGDALSGTIAPVTKLTAVPTTDEKELEISWTNPNDDALLKVSISFMPTTNNTGSAPNPVLVNATKGTEQKISLIMPQAVKYVVSVVAINKAGAKSNETTVQATPFSVNPPAVVDNTPLFLRRADTMMTSLVQLYLTNKPRDIWQSSYPNKPQDFWDGAAVIWGHGGVFSGYAALREASESYPAYKQKMVTLYDARLLTGIDKFRNRANNGPEAYAVYPGTGDERFYDDNIWVGLDMVDLYQLTKSAGYLDRAKIVWNFVLAGTDTKMGGGVYWKEFGNSKNTCSSAPAAVLAAKLYQATKEPAYLQSAKELYEWTKSKLQDPSDYLYWDNVTLSNPNDPNSALNIAKDKYQYNSGQPMQAAVLLYNITGETKYLTDAQNIAQSAYKKWFIPFASYALGEQIRILEPGHVWFQAIMFRGFIELYKVDHNKTYVNAFKKTMSNAWLSNARNRTTNLINNDLRGGTTQTSFDILMQGACLEMMARLALLEKEGL